MYISLTYSLVRFFSYQDNIGQICGDDDNVCKSMKQKDSPALATNNKMNPVDMEEVNYMLSVMHLHFDGECYFDSSNRMFTFTSNVRIKLSIVKTVFGWNNQPWFNGILYDEKFVWLLMNFVIGKENIQNDNIAKEQYRFIESKNHFYHSQLFVYVHITIKILFFRSIFASSQR